MNPIYAFANLGTNEHPKSPDLVRVLRQADTAGFFVCLTADGTSIVVARQYLSLTWHPLPKTPANFTTDVNDTTKSALPLP